MNIPQKLNEWFVYELTNCPDLFNMCKTLCDAIIEHRSQKADDRCIEDDDKLYAALGDGIKCDRRVGSKGDMLSNCERFIHQRTEEGGWVSYVELEEENRKLKSIIKKMIDIGEEVWQFGSTKD